MAVKIWVQDFFGDLSHEHFLCDESDLKETGTFTTSKKGKRAFRAFSSSLGDALYTVRDFFVESSSEEDWFGHGDGNVFLDYPQLQEGIRLFVEKLFDNVQTIQKCFFEGDFFRCVVEVADNRLYPINTFLLERLGEPFGWLLNHLRDLTHRFSQRESELRPEKRKLQKETDAFCSQIEKDIEKIEQKRLETIRILINCK